MKRHDSTIDMEQFAPGEIPKMNGTNPGIIKDIAEGPNKGRYMLKEMAKIDTDDNEVHRGQAISEFVFGDAFRAILGQQAPVIGLAVDNKKDQLFLTSKFLEGFVEMDKFCAEYPENLSKVKGLEKVIITSLFCGDSDVNGGNIGVIPDPSSDIDNPSSYLAVKIDHGAAGSLGAHESIEKILKSRFAIQGYASQFQFDMREARKAIKEILAVPVEEFVKNSVSQLEECGVNTNIQDILTGESIDIRSFSDYLKTGKEELNKYVDRTFVLEKEQLATALGKNEVPTQQPTFISSTNTQQRSFS